MQGNNELIINFSKNIYSAMREVEGLGYLKAAFEDRINEFRDYELEQFELIYSMLTMSVFREVTGCQWLIPLNGQKNA